MSLIYALVARGDTILAEHTTSQGNFTQITQTILNKIPPNSSKLTYVYDSFLFHYISDDGLVFLCMADESVGRRVPFSFLAELKSTFLNQYSREQIDDLPPYGLNEFSRTIEKMMIDFSNGGSSSDRLKSVQGEIDQVKDVMVHNVERILNRGERIELLVDKTENMSQQAFAFRKRSTQLRRQMWWKNMKLMTIMGISGVFFLYLLIGFACGLPTYSYCRN